METKFCRLCRRDLPLTEYTKRSDLRGGLNYCCRECGKKNRNNWYKLHSKREAERAEKYRKNLAPGVLKARKEKDYKRNRERVFNTSLLWRYNLPRARYDALLELQGNKCAICKSPKPGGKGTWHVDHDKQCCGGEVSKSCGKCIRGLLCHGCNVGLGALGNNSAVLFNAIFYLGRPPFKQVLHQEPDIFGGVQ